VAKEKYHRTGLKIKQSKQFLLLSTGKQNKIILWFYIKYNILAALINKKSWKSQGIDQNQDLIFVFEAPPDQDLGLED